MPIIRIAGNVRTRGSRSAWWSRRTALFALALALIAVAAHRLKLLDTPPFLWTLALVAALAICALLLAAAGFQRVWHVGDRGGFDLTIGVLVALLVLAPLATAAVWAYTNPPLSDISTDMEDPPTLTAAAAFRTSEMNPTAWMAENAPIQAKAYPALTGRRYAVSFDQITKAVEELIKHEGWQIISPLPAGLELEFTVEAVATQPVLAFPFDVAVRVTDEGNATYVDMRSASRFGTRDMGVNAARIEAFLSALDGAASALAGTAPRAAQ